MASLLNSLVKDKIDFVRNFSAGLALFTFLFNALYLSKITVFLTVYRITYPTEFNISLFFSPEVDMGVIASSISLILTLPNPKARTVYLLIAPLWATFVLALINYDDPINLIFTCFAFLLLVYTLLLPRLPWLRVPITTTLHIEKNIPALLLPILFFEVGSVITWILYPIQPSDIYGNNNWWFATIESYAFYSFGKLSLYLILVLVSGLAVRYLVATGKRFFHRYKQASVLTNSPTPVEPISSTIHRVTLVAALILSSIMILFPYIPTINEDGTPLSTDIPIYIELIDGLEDSDTSVLEAAFTEVAGGDRAIALLILYGLKELLPFDLSTILKYLPLALGPLTVLTIFKFVGTYSRKYASLSALFFIFSFQFVSGIYAGFYANWIALIVLYALMWALMRYLDKLRLSWLVIVFVLSMSVLFIHIYTWGVMIVMLTAFFGFYCYDYLKSKDKGLIKILVILGVIIISNISLDLVRSFAIEVKGGITKDAELLGEFGGWQEYESRWFNLNYLFSIYLGGSMMNSAMLILAIYGSLALSWRSHFAKLVLASIYGLIIPVVFGNYTLQARVLFDLPIHILAAIGFMDIIVRIDKKYGLLSSVSLVLFMILHFANYLLRNLSNLLYRPPL